jgi:hypothetical protein
VWTLINANLLLRKNKITTILTSTYLKYDENSSSSSAVTHDLNCTFRSMEWWETSLDILGSSNDDFFFFFLASKGEFVNLTLFTLSYPTQCTNWNPL